MIATQQDIVSENEYIEEISKKLASLCMVSDKTLLNQSDPYHYYLKLKYQLHVICLDLLNYQTEKANMKLTSKTQQLLEDVKRKLYDTVENVNNIASHEDNQENMFLWKKLLGDYYRNLCVLVPEEKFNAKKMYCEALEISSCKHTNQLYIGLVLDYSCLLADVFDNKQEALRKCLKLLIEIQKQKNFVPDSMSSAYLKFIRRNITLWRKQI